MAKKTKSLKEFLDKKQRSKMESELHDKKIRIKKPKKKK